MVRGIFPALAIAVVPVPIDGEGRRAHQRGVKPDLAKFAAPRVVGSVGCREALAGLDPTEVREACDVVELRLDSLAAGGGAGAGLWAHLRGVPLLFTARSPQEGGVGALGPGERIALLEMALPDAAMVDLEAAGIDEAEALRGELRERGVPWIASFHDFRGLPDAGQVARAVGRAREAGAAAFKLAARVCEPGDLRWLADFQCEDHGLPVATMGMGALGPVSRLLCAQCGSCLNYGFLGGEATAPGQWDAAFLKRAIAGLEPWHRETAPGA